MQVNLIERLQKIQKENNYLPRKELDKLSIELGVSIPHIYGVATFYSQFRLTPIGKHRIKICRGTACHVMNSISLFQKIRSVLDLIDSEDTTKDMLFTVEEVACLGCCSLAPAIMIDEKVYGKVTEEKIKEILDEYRK